MYTPSIIHTVRRPALLASPTLRGVRAEALFAGRKPCYACRLGACRMDQMPTTKGPVC